jgi:hypothetical protein
MSPPSAESKDKPRKKPGRKQLVSSSGCHPVLYLVLFSPLMRKLKHFFCCRLITMIKNEVDREDDQLYFKQMHVHIASNAHSQMRLSMSTGQKLIRPSACRIRKLSVSHFVTRKNLKSPFIRATYASRQVAHLSAFLRPHCNRREADVTLLI